MTSRTSRRLTALAAFLFGSTSVLAADPRPATPAEVPGDLWEVTSRMSMEGMPMEMPAHTQRVCAPKEWKEPPAGKNEQGNCTTSEFKMAGSKATWKLRCEGPPAMTGEGEIIRKGPDAYSGVIKFTSSDGVMTLKLSGRRLDHCEAVKK